MIEKNIQEFSNSMLTILRKYSVDCRFLNGKGDFFWSLYQQYVSRIKINKFLLCLTLKSLFYSIDRHFISYELFKPNVGINSNDYYNLS